jgi:hypothetical protein
VGASRRLLIAAGAVLGGVVLTACGGDPEGDEFAEQSPYRIARQTIEAMQALDSMRVKGLYTESEGTFDIDLAVDADGNCTGTIGAKGGTARVLRVDGEQYLKGSLGFWTATDGAAMARKIQKEVGSRWVKVSEQDRDFDELCSLEDLTRSMNETFTDGELLNRGTVTDTGRRLVQLRSDDDGGYTTVRIDVDAPHLPADVTTAGSSHGRLSFSDFDEPLELTVPADKDVLDMTGAGPSESS